MMRYRETLNDPTIEVKLPPRPGGQNCCLRAQKSRVRFSEIPDFLSSSGSRTGFNQSREDK
jgi:hypothetical protein